MKIPATTVPVPIARRSWPTAAIVLVSMAIAVPGASAQITAAKVSGVVIDETGGVLPGVDVTLKNIETGLTRSVVTADDGSYNIPGLPPGMYDARASLPGFTPAVRRDIQLAVGQEASLNLTLRVGASEVVIVAGAPALVDTKSSSLSALVGEKTIQELPLNGRNFIELTLLQPGVAALGYHHALTSELFLQAYRSSSRPHAHQPRRIKPDQQILRTVSDGDGLRQNLRGKHAQRQIAFDMRVNRSAVQCDGQPVRRLQHHHPSSDGCSEAPGGSSFPANPSKR